MINVIQFLEKNPSVVTALKENKASLLGVTEQEQQAIVETFEGELNTKGSMYWD
ncbi:competence pheromone ComX [Lysinibacillus piscis]|uniref:ComX pheromone n=1 Tax=Lysinibacillus piscis TaxID=2518931 RepID=A0ABQ5NK31_9BACI|nr:competence pheromone ComX [Lysinibacillus sp. KH24]GLC88725.1 hypothetical protein LYSBPC_18520 [Lysinibacillus sp. KH24]